MIEAETVEDGRHDVAGTHGAFRRKSSDRVARAHHAAAFDALESALQAFGGYASCIVLAERNGRLGATLHVNARFRGTTLDLPAAQALLAATRLHLPILMHENVIESQSAVSTVPPVFQTLLASLDLSGLESRDGR